MDNFPQEEASINQAHPPVASQEQLVDGASTYKKAVGILALLVIVLSVFALGSLAYIQLLKNQLMTAGTVSQDMGVQTTQQSGAIGMQADQENTSEKVIFTRDKNLWLLQEGQEKQLTTGGNAYTYAVSADQKKVAYIDGERIPNVNDYVYVTPYQLKLLDLTSMNTTIIWTQEVIRSEQNLEYELTLKDVSFSSDGSLLAFTTSDSVYIYNFSTKETRQVYTKPFDANSYPVFAYVRPRFSPDNTKLIVDVGYYEGSGTMILDLNTQQATQLPYTAYVSGERVLDWYDNDTFLLTEYDGPSGEQSVLFFVEWPSLEKSQIAQFTGTMNFPYRDGDVLYMNAVEQRPQKIQLESGEIIDSAVEYTIINKIDLKTGAVAVLYDALTDQNDISLRLSKIVGVDDGKLRLFAWESRITNGIFDQDSSVYKYVLFDPATKTFETILSDAGYDPRSD